VLGVLVIAIGAVWAGQGAGLIGGSFMTGSPFWGVAGVIAVVLGVGLALLALRRGRA
jgi:hypothetical protein